jgi:hypothetical protein
MVAVVDYRVILRHCDRFVFVEWQRIVLECLSAASALLDRVVCIVLNKVAPSALRSIEHYKADRFLEYCGDKKRALELGHTPAEGGACRAGPRRQEQLSEQSSAAQNVRGALVKPHRTAHSVSNRC